MSMVSLRHGLLLTGVDGAEDEGNLQWTSDKGSGRE